MSEMASRIATARKGKNLNQSQLARALGVSPQAVQSWEMGRSEPRRSTLLALCAVLDVEQSFIQGEVDGATSNKTTPGCTMIKIISTDALVSHPVRQVDRIGFQPIPDQELAVRGVLPDTAVCTYVTGNGLSPRIPHNSLVCIDLSNIDVVDGGVYALAQQGEVRFKLAYRIPGGGLRLSSYNRDEHPDEIYSSALVAEQSIKILGKIFWVSCFLP